MKYKMVEKELSQFAISDLINFLGEKKAGEFLRQYRHQIAVVVNGELRIRCANLSELVSRWKDDSFLQ